MNLRRRYISFPRDVDTRTCAGPRSICHQNHTDLCPLLLSNLNLSSSSRFPKSIDCGAMRSISLPQELISTSINKKSRKKRSVPVQFSSAQPSPTIVMIHDSQVPIYNPSFPTVHSFQSPPQSPEQQVRFRLLGIHPSIRYVS